MEVVTGYKAIPTHTLLIHHTHLHTGHALHPLTLPIDSTHLPTHSTHPLTPHPHTLPTHPTHSPRPPCNTCGHCPLIDQRSLAACVMLGYFPTAPAHVGNKAICASDVISLHDTNEHITHKMALSQVSTGTTCLHQLPT